jgi:RNA polymerase sigma factor (TIGR02999 family)
LGFLMMIEHTRPGEVTELVQRWSSGDALALEPLIALVYGDLRRIARSRLAAQAPDATLCATALVHELYLKLAGVTHGDWGGRARFFAFCSKAMRRILVDHARRRRTAKRGGGAPALPMDERAAAVEAVAAEVLVVDETLGLLETRNARMARIVECRFFGGLSVPETAVAVGASSRTVEREWARATAYLREALDGS